MRRGVKVGLGVAIAFCALVALLAINALIVDGETEDATVTVPGGRILDLPGGRVQVVEQGPTVVGAAAAPIVLIHCFSCAIDWWDEVRPRLSRRHRVIALDLRGHGGSEKPASGYTPPDQASLVAEAMRELDVSGAVVVGHSLGGAVSVALAERSPRLVERVTIIDMPPDHTYGDLGLLAWLAFQPLIGEALWAIKPDFSVRDGLSVAFAPGFEVPDAFVEDVKRMTYTSYDSSPAGTDDFLRQQSLDRRIAATGKPLMVLMGAEEQIVDDPQRALDQYASSVPSALTVLVAGAGHSPNVERPELTARLLLEFAKGAERP